MVIEGIGFLDGRRDETAVEVILMSVTFDVNFKGGTDKYMYLQITLRDPVFFVSSASLVLS